MKITAVILFKWNPDREPAVLGTAADLSNFGFFQRGPVKEMITFMSRTIVQRTQQGQRQTVKQDDYFCHVHVRDSQLAAVVISDKDYPTTAAFSVVTKTMDDFVQQDADGTWRSVTADVATANVLCEQALAKYQDPAAADKIVKIQRDLDATKVILHETIDSVLQRGEKLDTLVGKSNDLSLASQAFYRQARKTNSCCRLM